ncbi:MAG: serine hydrolase [Candidatus Aminicenantes bacterium]|nr:MAG: serine hydrolase [Candidatus Aminicenantes bacterium]
MFKEKISRIQHRKQTIFSFLIILASAYSLTTAISCKTTNAELEARIQRIEAGLIPQPGIVIKGQPAQKASLAERMIAYKVPGVSIAVINDFKIEWAKGYGFKEAGGNDPVTTKTLFQAASISKPVAGLAALHFVEQGVLDLDEDVNEKLVSWKVPENEFTEEKKVSLRGILSHSAGLTVHGFLGYSYDKNVPTLRQVLDGEKPANSAPIRVDIEIGKKFRYSGGGFTVMQQLLIDILNKPFPEIMQGTVLEKLAMNNSTYEQPLPESLSAQAATAHRMNGKPIKGKWHSYPEMAAAGLWTTPTDLCRFAIEIMLSKTGRSNKILSQDMIQQMLSVQIGSLGLGLFLNYEGDDFRFSHGGGNEGFKCFLGAFPEKGWGAAVMTNGDRGKNLFVEILRSVAAEYGWNDFLPRKKTVAEISPEIYESYVGTYQFTPTNKIEITKENSRLFADPVFVLPAGKAKCEIFPDTETIFFMTRSYDFITFLKDKEGRVTGLELKHGNLKRKATKINLSKF